MTEPALTEPAWPMRFRRRPGWQALLPGWIAARERRSFAWGDFDCVSFAADWVAEMTGQDPIADFRGRYRTRLGAARKLKGFAGGGTVEAADRVVGRRLASPLLARRGDVVAVAVETPASDGGGRAISLGLVDGSGARIASPGPQGLMFAPLSDALIAWGIG